MVNGLAAEGVLWDLLIKVVSRRNFAYSAIEAHLDPGKPNNIGKYATLTMRMITNQER